VAEALGGEIVGCDALQVYRGLDAGTAKPSAAERRVVRHWLVDVADPRRDYSLADYVGEADGAIASIAAAGRVPIVVGGTGMYLRGLLKGIVALPPRDETLRARLHALVARRGPERVWRILAARDPGTARRVPPGDRQRVVRALELVFTEGPLWSERLGREGSWAASAERYRALKFGIDLERRALVDRLADRVDAFFAAGLVEEVEALLASGLPPTVNALKAIGYREIVEALAAGKDPDGTRAAVAAATRRYAKRQRTWFRREENVTWLDAGEGEERLAARIVSAWEQAC
jgi:tRNA dimethylallyltransferase